LEAIAGVALSWPLIGNKTEFNRIVMGMPKFGHLPSIQINAASLGNVLEGWLGQIMNTPWPQLCHAEYLFCSRSVA